MRLSHSRMDVFNKCKRQFYYQYIKNIKVASDDRHARRGSVFHKCAEHIVKNNPNIEQLKNFFNAKWLEYKLEDFNEHKDETYNMVLNFYNAKPLLTSTELEVLLPSPEFIGYIDGINSQEDIIYDWKTSTWYNGNSETAYKDQMGRYAYLYLRKFGRLPKKLIVYWVKYFPFKTVEYVFTEDDVFKYEQEIFEINNYIEEHKDDINAYPQCGEEACEANTFCPYGNECSNKIKYILHITGPYIRIDGEISPRLNIGLEKKFSYELKNAHWIKKNYPQANTTVRLWKQNKQLLPIGFLEGLKKTLRDYVEFMNKKNGTTKNLEIEVVDDRHLNEEKIEMLDKFLNNNTLREYQEQASNVFLDSKVGLLEIGTGGGKCFAKGTPILMFDLSIKNVEDINVGDLLMGDDGTPRTVLSLARGQEQMYNIKQKNGIMYSVNKSHILSLKKLPGYLKNIPDKIDISIDNYFSLRSKTRFLRGYKGFFDLPEKSVLIEPYYLGIWLGDGGHKNTGICTKDEEIKKYLKNYGNRLGLDLVEYKEKRGNTKLGTYVLVHHKGGGKPNILLDYMRKYNLIGNKHIPYNYINNSRRIRLELLAGLIDTDGYVRKGNTVEITQVRKALIEQIKFLADSLGYCTRITPCFNKKYKKYYYKLSIYGSLEDIPTKILYKRFNKRKNWKRYLYMKIKVEKAKVSKYYGFVIDGNKRFLLSDFTVVHNTEIAVEVIRKLACKTLFIVDKRELMRQTKHRIEDYLGIQVGQIGEGEQQIEHVTVATIQTLIKRRQELADYLSSIRLVVFDECHKVPAKSYGKISLYLSNTEYRLGLTATAFRDDGNDMLIEAVTGPKIFDLSSKVLITNGWLMKPRVIFYRAFMPDIFIEEAERKSKEGLINETNNYAKFYDNFIMLNTYRNQLIVNLAKNGIKTVVLVKLVEHGKLLEQLIPNSKYLYGETTTEERQDIFAKFLSGEITTIISTISIMSEGIDMPHLDTIINAAANKGNVKTVQILGRILRKLEGKTNAKYIDFIDESRFFKLASYARKRILSKEGHDIEVEDASL